jgi:membrane fusion protein, heavy metal efflux system
MNRTDMITKRHLLPALVSLALAACGAPVSDDHGHEHAPADEPAGAHAHGPADSTLSYTDYRNATELFVEFPALVAGEVSTFAAHVTRLADYSPLTSGRLDVVLEANGETAARFRVTAPARTGIFTPAVRPRDAGTFDLVIEVTDGALHSRHELGTVTVFANAGAIEVNQPELGGDIGYLKEQQWTNPFATVLAAERPMRRSVPGFATVLVPADAGAEIPAPADGYFAATDLVRAGSSVEAGTVLGYLVPRLGGGTDFGSLLVALERAQAQKALADRDVERLDDLLRQGAIAERRLSEARRAADVAAVELSAARARVEQYQRSNQQAGIALRAPVTGNVIEVNARPGAFVRAGDRVFRVAAPDRRWLEIRVPEHYATGLQNTSGAWFNRDEGNVVVLDDRTEAHVVQVGTAIDPATRTASVTVEYPTAQGPEPVGSRFAAHVFTSAPEPLLAIPRSAIVDDGGRDVVYVQTGGESFVRRPVELGIYDGAWVEARNGLVGGERVVSKGAYFVKLAAAGGEEIGHGHAH